MHVMVHRCVFVECMKPPVYMYTSIHPYLYIHIYMFTYIYMCTPLHFVFHIRDPMVYVLVAQLCDTQPLHMSNNTFAHPQIYIHSCTIVCRDGGMRSTRAQHPPSDSHSSPHQKIPSRAPGTDSCNLCEHRGHTRMRWGTSSTLRVPSTRGQPRQCGQANLLRIRLSPCQK